MSKTTTLKQLKQELEFIKPELDTQVYCRDLGYGYQLVFKHGKKETRIFIRKYEEAVNENQ